jgi:hypothetical protein
MNPEAIVGDQKADSNRPAWDVAFGCSGKGKSEIPLKTGWSTYTNIHVYLSAALHVEEKLIGRSAVRR